jgi:hypothetical protein
MKNDPQLHPAFKRYLAFNKNYPNIKAEYQKFDRWYFENKAHSKHKDGVYVPADVLASNSTYLTENFSHELMGMHTLIKDVSEMNHNELKVMSFINGFKMFQAWRMSLSIYTIDNDIFTEMLCTRQKNHPHPIFIGLGVKKLTNCRNTVLSLLKNTK